MSGLVFLVLYPLSVVIYGAVASTLWAWFLVPLGVPPVGVAHAVGVYALLLILAKTFRANDTDTSFEHLLALAFGGLIYALLALTTGWVALQAMGVSS